jgi:hypothetical protein
MNKNDFFSPTFQNDVLDVVQSVFSLKLKTQILFASVFGGFSLGALTSFVTGWIFDPAASYFALIALIGADHVTGVVLALRNNRFETRKAIRIFWTLLSHTGLLLFATNLAKGSDALFWLNEGVFVPLVLVNLFSLIKNLSLLGYLKKDFAGFFYSKIDAYKNDYIKKNEVEQSEKRRDDRLDDLDS